jgi:hypothetical protein
MEWEKEKQITIIAGTSANAKALIRLSGRELRLRRIAGLAQLFLIFFSSPAPTFSKKNL